MANKTKKSRQNTRRPKKQKSPSISGGTVSRAGMLRHATTLHQSGKLTEAETIYRKILKAKPDHPEALQYLGLLSHQLGKSEIAIKLLTRAVSCKPGYAEAHYNLGIVLLLSGRAEDAGNAFHKVLALNPDSVEALNNLGSAFLSQGKLKEAVASYRRALNLRPGYVDANFNLGNALRELGNLEEACISYRMTLKLQPDHHNAHYNLGKILQEMGKPDEAATSYRQALAVQPNFFDTHNNLGNALLAQGNLDDALASFQRAIDLKPDYAKAYSNLLICLNYFPDISQKEIYEKSLEWNDQFTEKMPKLEINCDSSNKSKLRIGYVSSDFREHSVAYYIEPVLKSHNRNNVEIYCYANIKQPDNRTMRIQAESDHWHSITDESDLEVAERIRSDGIDILVDLNGHTAGNRLLVFAYKPAPIQISWIGYPNTTGMNTIDYRFTDAIADAVGEADNYHSEELVRLEHGFLCYEPNPSAPAISPLPAIYQGHTTFGCFNNLSKVTPEVVKLWADILHAVSSSRLILKSKGLGDEVTKSRYISMFGECGISAKRLELHGWLASKEEHFALYNKVDIGLDTFPYNGTTTTCEALWMGVPVVTLCGNRHAARVGTSLLHHVGISDLVSYTIDEYKNLAVSLAQSENRLQSLRFSLREMMLRSKLMDRNLFVDTLEKTYRQMWIKLCNNI